MGKAGLPPPFNVLLSCYSIFKRRSSQQKDDRKVLKRWQWSCIILDEAHVMKDKNSYRWKNLMSVAKSARQRLMLTGTSLQNDLHLLLLFCNSGAKDVLTSEHVLGSAKCQVLAALLSRLSIGGHRVLIFNQWTAMLDILEWALEVIGVTYRRLDGSTQVSERQTIVDAFNNDPSIFACLLSTRAGGQGLNLVGADTVIIHDMDFNPQMDRQAEDRCHRIGQPKPVTIYRLVTRGTVDENVYEIARRKLVLDAAVLESGTELKNGNDVPQKTMGEILSSLLLV